MAIFGNAVAMDGGEISLDVRIDGGELNLVSEFDGDISEYMPILPEQYTGQTDVSPTEEVQTLLTRGLVVPDNVTVEAIPSDYIGSSVARYQGQVEITPTQETQVLQTDSNFLESNITINPIPSNYGLITWNGATLTVS